MDIIHGTIQNFESVVAENDLVLVDFWATWCGHCIAVAPVMEQLAQEYDGKLAVVKINLDEETDLGVKFGVQSIPLVLLFKGGKLLSSHLGARPADYYREIIDEQL